MHRRILAVIAMAGLLAACAPAVEKEAYDPFESVNRGIFAFNKVLDDNLIVPVARGYRYVTPKSVRTGVDNFLDNLSEPVTMLNSALQGDIENTFTSFWRFVLNTTFGLGGIYDFASNDALLAKRSEGFGDTLGTWGVSGGPYLVLPIMGPSNLRDLTGRVADGYSDPFNYILADPDVCDGDDCLIARGVVTGLVKREQLLDPMQAIYEDSLDPYATFRSLYTQLRANDIMNKDTGNPLDTE